jgi:hypothetical protein
MSDWYDAAKAHFNAVTGKAHAAFADAAREFYDNGGDATGGAVVTPQTAPAALTDAPTADDFNGLVTLLKTAGVLK